MSATFNQSIINTTCPSTLELTEKRVEIIGDILELYQCKPQSKLYRHFHNDITFEDPLCDARNLTELKAQFNTMPKIFTNSETKACEIISNNEDEIRMNIVQAYTIVGLGNVVEVASFIVINLDENEKVVCWEDMWDNKAGWKEFGCFTSMTNYLRRLNAQVLPCFIDTD